LVRSQKCIKIEVYQETIKLIDKQREKIKMTKIINLEKYKEDKKRKKFNMSILTLCDGTTEYLFLDENNNINEVGEHTAKQLWEINEEVVKSTLGEMCEKLNNNKNLPFVQQTIPYSDLNLESVGA